MIESRRFLLGLSVLTSVAALALVAWKVVNLDPPATTRANPTARGAAAVGPAAVGFDQVLAVLSGGGTSPELENAIGFLDTAARVGRVLTDAQRAALLAALESGTPAGMAEGSWSHIFNSACNALTTSKVAPDEALLGLLERVAADDPRLVMRLYALQHLDCRYDAASPTSQRRLRSLVQRLLADPSSKTAGTALVLWRRWEKSAGPGNLSSLEQSRAIAADAGRPVDVRVTALHAIGENPGVLDLARTLAQDRSQPVILRKAALNLIGRHGGTQDLAMVRLCSQESQRLAQAGKPAARALEDRLAGIPQPVQ